MYDTLLLLPYFNLENRTYVYAKKHSYKTHINVSTFLRDLLLRSILKMETACSPETLILVYQIIRHHVQDSHDIHTAVKIKIVYPEEVITNYFHPINISSRVFFALMVPRNRVAFLAIFCISVRHNSLRH
jgi:hypothetical protein